MNLWEQDLTFTKDSYFKSESRLPNLVTEKFELIVIDSSNCGICMYTSLNYSMLKLSAVSDNPYSNLREPQSCLCLVKVLTSVL